MPGIKKFKGFKNFIKNQGIVGLAVGFILGGAISKFVTSLVVDIINPILHGLLGGVNDLDTEVFHVGHAAIHYGTFINNGIDFIVIAFVVYFGVSIFNIDEEQIGKVDLGKIGALNAIKK
ncbi:MAG: MscL family protein [bacterium]